MKRYLAVLAFLALPALLAAMLRAPPSDEPILDAAPPLARAAEPAAPKPPAPAAPAPRVQVALLLDNSGSMSGLLEQARSELWTIVNELSEATFQGRPAKLEVALYSYGDPPAKLLVPFTTDLDRVSEALFALGIEGGDEYCGQAIDLSLEQLAWSEDPAALKLLFIAGNEPFTQGPVDHEAAIAEARQKGVVVSTIHCGPKGPFGGQDWKRAAMLAGGAFANIDHDAKVAHVASPFDEEIARLGVELNATYVPYGGLGVSSAARQSAQDENALGISAQIGTKRALAKASASYRNSHWDLVDATKDGTVKLGALKDEELPEGMRGLDEAGRKAWLQAAGEKREELRRRIAELNEKREAFVAAAKKEQAGGASTLDQAILAALRAQATTKGFRLAGM